MAEKTAKSPEFDISGVGYVSPYSGSEQEGEDDNSSQEEQETQSVTPEAEDTSPDKESGQGGESEKGQGEDEFESVINKHGFKSKQEFYENWKDQFNQNKDLATKVNEYQQENAYIKGLLEAQVKEKKEPEKQLTDEELTEMLTDKPAEFAKWLQEQIQSSLFSSEKFKQIESVLNESQKVGKFVASTQAISQMRRNHKDFSDYEADIDEELKKLGSSLQECENPGVLEHFYEFVKRGKAINEYANGKEKANKANQTVDKEAEKAAKALKGGSQNAAQATEKEEGQPEYVETPLGKMRKEDYDLVYDKSSLMTMGVQPKIQVQE